MNNSTELRSIWRRKRPLDDPRDVGHDERLAVTTLDDTQIGFERREGVVGDLGLGSRHDRQQRRLAGIREPDQPDVGEHLQLQYESPFVALLARLRITRRLIRRTLEVPVAQSSAAAFEQYQPLAVGRHLAHGHQLRLALLVLHDTLGHRAQRHGDDDVARIFARRTGTRPALAVLGELVALVFEVDERPILTVALQNDAAAPSAIAAVGAAEGDELLPTEMRRTGTAVPRTGENLHVVYKVRTSHITSI